MRNKKNRKKNIIVISITAIAVVTFSLYLIDRFSYSKILPFYSVAADTDSSLAIGILGASWVAYGKMDTVLRNAMLKKGFNSRIISAGQPGAASKVIYQNLFKEKDELNSSKYVIENRPRYCIVIGGVNDAVSQLGGKFYAYHTIQIVKTLLHYNITPVVISLPEFGIIESTNDLNFFSKYRNIISAYFNNHGETDNIKTYRKIFEQALASENLKDSIVLIDFDKVCADYNKCTDLYANPSHLSKIGNELFCETIATGIANKIKER